VSVEAGITDVTTLVAAVLHDTIEDTKTTYDELLARFGQEVASVVPRSPTTRHSPRRAQALQVVHAPHISQRAALVKLATRLATCATWRQPAGGLAARAPARVL